MVIVFVFYERMLIVCYCCRQNRRPMLARYPRMLQVPDSVHAEQRHPAPVGIARSGEDRAAGQVGGGDGGDAG